MNRRDTLPFQPGNAVDDDVMRSGVVQSRAFFGDIRDMPAVRTEREIDDLLTSQPVPPVVMDHIGRCRPTSPWILLIAEQYASVMGAVVA